MITHLAFSKWKQVIPNARLSNALLDRVTEQSHVIKTGTDWNSCPERLAFRALLQAERQRSQGRKTQEHQTKKKLKVIGN